MTDPFADLPIKMEALLNDAVAQILKYENPELFKSWMRKNFENYYTGPVVRQASMFDTVEPLSPEKEAIGPDILQKLASNLAPMIWNSMPLPSNHFRPKPVPLPGRNEPCHCGSGKKYKQCCAKLPAMSLIPMQDTWPLIFEKLDKKTAARAIQENHVPLKALCMIANDYLVSDLPKKAMLILAPLFEGAIHKTNDDADFALNMLCNAYDELGYKIKKKSVLQNILDTAPKSPLRSGAWQRLAAIRMDSGDVEGAWQAFQHAQRDDPKSLSLGLLEVQILHAQGQLEKARQRADFWVRQMQRYGVEEDDLQMDFLKQVCIDPVEAFAQFEMGMDDDAGLLLKQWLEMVQQRPVPEYSISNESLLIETDEDGMQHVRKRLLSQGISEEQIELAIQSIQSQSNVDLGKEQSLPDDHLAERSPFHIQTPGNVQSLEQDWHDLFPLSKPYSIYDRPLSDEDPWELNIEQDWSQWLMEHPQAFDSLDILDDLATALILHPQFGSRWVLDLLLMPILQRSEDILDQTMESGQVTELPWVIDDNRPALRALARQVNIATAREDADEIMQRAQKILSINPHDNHGFRMLIMDQLIYAGHDEEALELADVYPDDLNPEVAFGKILALYRLDRKKEAVQELGEALEYLDKIPHYLIAKRVKKPRLVNEGITMGGDDQAWYYREAMRDVWLQTPGALDWLKKTEKVFSWD